MEVVAEAGDASTTASGVSAGRRAVFVGIWSARLGEQNDDHNGPDNGDQRNQASPDFPVS